MKLEKGSREWTFLMTIRQAVIIFLGGIEDYMELPRSIPPKNQRRSDL